MSGALLFCETVGKSRSEAIVSGVYGSARAAGAAADLGWADDGEMTCVGVRGGLPRAKGDGEDAFSECLPVGRPDG